MSADPFEALHDPWAPLAPDDAFAALLRARLEAALDGAPTAPQAIAPDHEEAAMPTTTPDHDQIEAIRRRQTVTPYLAVRDARAAIEWYGEVLGAEVVGGPIEMDDGRIGHVELRLGGAIVFLADEFPEVGALAPPTLGGSTTAFVLEVDDVDRVYAWAVERGATADRPPEDHPYGRSGWLVDPFGHRWSVATTPSR